MLQINKQDQKCLLALIAINNLVFNQGESIWLSYTSFLSIIILTVILIMFDRLPWSSRFCQFLKANFSFICQTATVVDFLALFIG